MGLFTQWFGVSLADCEFTAKIADLVLPELLDQRGGSCYVTTSKIAVFIEYWLQRFPKSLGKGIARKEY